MKEGAIIHRFPWCHCVLRSRSDPHQYGGSLYGFSQARITGLCPAPFRLPERGDSLSLVRIFPLRSGRGANGNPPLPEPPTKAAKSSFPSMTIRQRIINTNRERSWQKASFSRRTLQRNTLTGKHCGMPSRKSRGNGTLSLPAESSWHCLTKFRKTNMRPLSAITVGNSLSPAV